MSHVLHADPIVHQLLLEIDRDIATEVRSGGCPACGGIVDVRNYLRKPRGGPAGLCEEHDLRFSYCCRADGCRAGLTPPSVRFFGRHVWFGAVVVLLSALQHGVTPVRHERLSEHLDVSRRTLERWRRWWLERFAACSFWTAARGRFATPVETARLPASLLECFAGDERERLLAALRFLGPISVGSARHGLAS